MTSRITDLQLAAYLLAKGHRIIGVGGPASRRVIEFEAAPEAVQEFYGGEDKISARRLFNSYHDVLGLVKHAAR